DAHLRNWLGRTVRMFAGRSSRPALDAARNQPPLPTEPAGSITWTCLPVAELQVAANEWRSVLYAVAAARNDAAFEATASPSRSPDSRVAALTTSAFTPAVARLLMSPAAFTRRNDQ